jgi:K+-transporting ATPase ATPase C chain
MKRQIVTAMLYMVVTAVGLGVVYPLVVTGLAHVLFARQADGQLIRRDGVVVGSRLIGQPFSGAGYFWSRPSNAGTGYDAANSGGSNLGPTNKDLATRVAGSVAAVNAKGANGAVPVDLVTASGSGLDPDISPAAALYQVGRVATERHVSEDALRALVAAHVTQRQFGLLGEPRVNVLELNLDLDKMAQGAAKQGADR